MIDGIAQFVYIMREGEGSIGYVYLWLVLILFLVGEMINSQSMSLSQKQKFWREHKEDRFKNMAGDKCAMWNYFFNNNDIFKFIDELDFQMYS